MARAAARPHAPAAWPGSAGGPKLCVVDAIADLERQLQAAASTPDPLLGRLGPRLPLAGRPRRPLPRRDVGVDLGEAGHGDADRLLAALAALSQQKAGRE
jgi:hypothetical protein